MGGNLTILALTHFGPEEATRLLSPLGVNANGQWRFYNDVHDHLQGHRCVDPGDGDKPGA